MVDLYFNKPGVYGDVGVMLGLRTFGAISPSSLPFACRGESRCSLLCPVFTSLKRESSSGLRISGMARRV